MKKVKLIFFIFCFLPTVFAYSETTSPQQKRKSQTATDIPHHEFRIGWGDMMFETVAFRNSPNHRWGNPEVLSADYLVKEKHHHTYSGHFFADYHYNVLRWLAVGMQIDFEAICWRETTYDRYHNAIGETMPMRNYDLSLLPSVRFTYLHSKWVNLYSGLSVGMLVAFDNQHKNEVAPAVNINLIGMAVGNEHWFGTVELGLLNAFKNANNIYMAGSRIFSVGIGYRFNKNIK